MSSYSVLLRNSPEVPSSPHQKTIRTLLLHDLPLYAVVLFLPPSFFRGTHNAICCLSLLIQYAHELGRGKYLNSLCKELERLEKQVHTLVRLNQILQVRGPKV